MLVIYAERRFDITYRTFVECEKNVKYMELILKNIFDKI